MDNVSLKKNAAVVRANVSIHSAKNNLKLHNNSKKHAVDTTTKHSDLRKVGETAVIK